MDEKQWPKPNLFKPERFLNEHGKFITNNLNGYNAFSVGRRKCPGEQLAINDLFMTLVRFLQLTNDYRVELYGEDLLGDILEPDSWSCMINVPQDYRIVLKAK